MSETLAPLYDDPSIARNTTEVAKYLKLLKIWAPVVARREIPLKLNINEAVVVPSLMRCRQAFATAAGKSALAAAKVRPEYMLKVHGQITPLAIKLFYADIQQRPGSLFSDVPLRLAQAAFELNLLHECFENPSARVFKMVGEDNPAQFERVRSTVLDNVFHRLHMVMTNQFKGKSLIDWREEYEGERSALPFLNTLFAKVTDPYVMELQNALEFTGFDLEDPAIIGYTINSHERFFSKDPALSAK